MYAALANNVPTIFAPNRGLIPRFIRWILGARLPDVGETFSFLVEERHWDEAKAACKVGSRSTNCILAQAIAEKLRMRYVAVSADGVVSAAYGQIDEVGGLDSVFVFRVDRAGTALINTFDRGENDPNAYRPQNFPFNITAVRLPDNNSGYDYYPAESSVVIA